MDSQSNLLAITCAACCHKDATRCLKLIKHNKTIRDIFSEVHNEDTVQYTAQCSTNVDGSSGYDIDESMVFGELMQLGDIKSLSFKCILKNDTRECGPDEKKSEQPSSSTTVDAFNILMSGQNVLLKKKSECQTRKDELFNNVVDDMWNRKLKIHKSVVDDEGNYITQVITNALWYITNQHTTINDTAKKCRDVLPVPPAFEKFQGYNDFKRKKQKSQPIDQIQCDSHANALFSICGRSTFNSSIVWGYYKEAVESLAECLTQYKVYLVDKLQKQNKRQSSLNPSRTVGSDISVQFRAKCPFVVDKYKLFDEKVLKAEYLQPVVFDERSDLATPFENATQKHRYFSNLQLSVSVDLFTYSPGGGISTFMFVAKVPENRSNNDAHVQPIRVLSQIHDQLPEYHTRAQKRRFKQKLNLIAQVKPAVADLIYKELTIDASAASNPVTQQRLRLISLGETGLLADLRELNPGRPSDKFDVFFEKLEERVEAVTAADERRHGEAHLSQWISLNDLIAQTVATCPEGTPVPSKSLVRLQFTPRNPYTHSALNFTSRIPVQYKIQKRQLRVTHPDQHYCAAQFKYLKSLAVELGTDAMMFCCDDKAKVPVGDPDVPVSTGVRGKKTLAPVNETLVACDHDMTKSSLCPSVYLECETPKYIEQSFVRGQVHIVVNDSVLQVSSPFRHAAAICKILDTKPSLPKVFLKFSDGGTDQRNTLESVKCASICIFKEYNFDLFIIARCAPGNSWANPAERVMSILNLGLQNCALERADDGKMFKSCNSMGQIREAIVKHPELRDVWVSSINPVQKLLEGRFQRLQLKDDPFRTIEPVTNADIDHLQRHLRDLFPEMDLTKLQKVHTRKVNAYQFWIDKHCQQRQYTFQIRKCNDPSCCIPPTLPAEQREWLPDPVLDGEHYKPYTDVKGQQTTEQDRPTFMKVPPVANKKKGLKINMRSVTAAPAIDLEATSTTSNASLFTAQHARFTIECCECRKPRVIYTKNKLTERQIMQMALFMSDEDYTCGAYLTSPTDNLHGTIRIRPGLNCTNIIELSYYSSDLGRVDICCYCGAPEAETDDELKQKFKTVLPICNECSGKGFESVCQRAYGKSK